MFPLWLRIVVVSLHHRLSIPAQSPATASSYELSLGTNIAQLLAFCTQAHFLLLLHEKQFGYEATQLSSSLV